MAHDVRALTEQLFCEGDFFNVEGCPAFLITPEGKAASSTSPWVWYAPTKLADHPSPVIHGCSDSSWKRNALSPEGRWENPTAIPKAGRCTRLSTRPFARNMGCRSGPVYFRRVGED